MKSLLLLFIVFLCTGCSYNIGVNNANSGELNAEISEIQIAGVADNMEAAAKDFFITEDYEKASAIYSQLVSMSPDNKNYRFMLADAKRLAGDFDAALLHYQCLVDDPIFASQAIEGRVLSFTQKGDFLHAVDAAVENPKIIDNSWKILNAIGIAYASINKMEEANLYYNRALDIGGNHPCIMNNIALSRVLSGDTDRGIEEFEYILREHTMSDKLRKQVSLNLALAYGMGGKFDKAEEMAGKYLSGRELYNNMGIYSLMASDEKLARVFLNKALNQSIIHYDKAWVNLHNLENGL
ncbi:putative Tetratricopeptide repeat protein [Candidatus Xenohaliotis californiensis]|uniref:Tetratricopeptide repeat protein n=1 Tax=Candidatus Xenohaliotis californiensis TaxID=84677 RepID=A0ABM9N9B4_9RICK|nr:putative Tetratricopeptide repeat protein [Candidatus Xenohaliotis californiensis]